MDCSIYAWVHFPKPNHKQISKSVFPSKNSSNCTFLRVFKNPHCCDIGILLELLVRLDDSDALVVVIECDIKKDLSFMVDHS